MRRLWHRLNTVPSQTHCIYCTTFSKNNLLFPSILSRIPSTTTTPQLFPLGLSKSYQTSTTLFPPHERNEAREETLDNTSLVDSNIQHTNKPALLADFYRSLSTQDIDRIWPLYTYLYNNNLLSLLTRKNFHNIFLYTIRSRPCQKNLHRLSALTDDMRQRGFHLRVSEYNAMIHWVGGKTVPNRHPHHLLDALQLFEDMQKSEIVDENGQVTAKKPVQPDVATFNTLIHIAAQLSDLRTAQKLYHDMISRGLQPDVYTYSTLLHSMGKIGDIGGIDQMLKDVRDNGLNSMANNTVIWNVVMSGYACNGYRDRAYAMFDQMVEAYISRSKSSNSSNSSSNIKAKKQKKKKNKLKSDQPTATSTTQSPIADAESYRIGIDLMVHDDRQQESIETLYKMKKLKIQPTITIYNTLFGSFMKPTKQHQLYDIEQVEQDPNRQEKLKNIQKLYKSMKDDIQQQQVKPNSETMYTLVSAFLDLGDTKSALETFVFLSNNHNNPQQSTTKRKSIQSNSISILAKERLSINIMDPLKIEPCQELLDRLNSVVTKSL